MKDVMIRAVTDGELERCAAVIRRGFETVARDYGLTPENCPTSGSFLQSSRLIRERQKGCLLFALFLQKKMVGFVELEPGRNETYVLEKLTVLPEYRHGGFGKLLLDFAVGRAKELGGRRIVLGMMEQNAVLKNWYLQNGFHYTETKHFPNLPFLVGMMEYQIQKDEA